MGSWPGLWLALFLALATVRLATAAEPLQPLATAPDRGNCEAAAYITGPGYPIAGFANDDLEVSLWNGPSPLAFSLAKNDVWDRRYFGDRRKPVDIEDIRRMCFGGTITPQNGPFPGNTPQALYLAYDFPCPKPVGQLILRCPDLEGAPWSAGRAADGSVVAHAEKGAARSEVTAFLCRTRNVLVLRGSCSGLAQPLQVQLFRHQDTTPQGTSTAGMAHYGGDTRYDYRQDPDNGPLAHPEAGQDGRFFWVRQAFPAEPTFPDGFEFVFMGTLAGAAGEFRAESRTPNLGALAVIHPVDPESARRMPGYHKELRISAERVNQAPSGSLASVTLAAPGATFDLLVTVVTTRDSQTPLATAKTVLEQALGAGPDALALESLTASEEAVRTWRNSRVMHYNATSCSFMDSTPWHGDYHFNEGYLTHDLVAGRAAEHEQRLRLFEEMLPALQANARDAYHCRGAAFSLVHYPIRSQRVVYSNYTWEWGIENTALMLQPFWQIYQYTQDLDFLRQRAYPMLVEGARFYADYVRKGDDGLYHVIPTVSQEHWGWTAEWTLNRDSVGALSFVKYLLKAGIEASETLGVDAPEREAWREIVTHLAPYPTLATPAGPVFCDVRDAPQLLNYNITANLVMVLWAEDISLDSPPEWLDLARRSYRAIPDKEQSMRPGYLQQIRLFLGMPDSPDLSPQGRVLSWPGRIHLYPGVPAGTTLGDSFAGLLAVGGFEVSASHQGTDVRRVRITSRAGRTCRLKSPWEPAAVKVLALPGRQVVAHTLDADTIAFPTEAGKTYAVLAGPELALATRRYVPAEKIIGKWSFAAAPQGVVRDESGAGHDARLAGRAAVRGTGQEVAMELDGEGSYATVARTPAFDLAAEEGFAVEVRFRLPPGPPPAMAPLLCSMALRQYCLLLDRGRAKLYLSSPTGDVYCQVRGTRVLTDGRWHTVRGIREVSDGTLRIEVDGRLEGTVPDTTGGDFLSDAPVTIGAYLWGEHSRYLHGSVASAEVRTLGRLVEGD